MHHTSLDDPPVFPITPLVLAAAISADSNQSNVSYSASSPVRVAACALDPVLSSLTSGDAGIIALTQLATNLNIKYVDVEKAISSVTFAVSDATTSGFVHETIGVSNSQWNA